MKLRNAGLFLFSGTKMALKSLRKNTTKLRSFLREYSISLYLSSCPFIINMYGIAFQTDECYIFAQEYAPAGDLFDIIPPQVRRSDKFDTTIERLTISEKNASMSSQNLKGDNLHRIQTGSQSDPSF